MIPTILYTAHHVAMYARLNSKTRQLPVLSAEHSWFCEQQWVRSERLQPRVLLSPRISSTHYPMTTTPTLSQLQRGLAISEQIAALETELAAIFNGSAPTSTVKAAPASAAQGDGRTGKRSAATIAKMKASQQARWAKVKAPAAVAKTPVVKKGGMSAEGRARIVAAQKARWAKIKGTKAPVVAKAPAPAQKKKGGMSPAHKAKLAVAAKARWAAIKAGKAPSPFAKKK